MKNINEIGILAVGTRMKRFYDNMMPAGRAIYLSHGLDFEPKWFTIIYALIENKELSVTDLSQLIGLSHPTIIQLLKELEKNGWVVSKKSKTDGRIRLLQLSEWAESQVSLLQTIWSHIRQAIEEMNAEGQVDFWEGFLEFEAAQMKKSVYDRVLEIKGRQKRNAVTKRVPSHPGQWFERKFDFKNLSTTPEGVMERLRFTPHRLREIVEDLSTAQATTSFKNKWSIQENIGHLNDLEPLWQGRVLDIVNGEKTMRPADLTNKKSHEAGHDEIPMEKLLSEFKVNRKKLLRMAEEHYDQFISASSKHPRLLTPMRMIDLLYFVAEHDDHHIATIRYLAYQV
ncbi:MAG: MarR family transcriptional regulator [Bacteroidota bacterium]